MDDEYPEEADLHDIRTFSPGPGWSGARPWVPILGLCNDAWNHDMGKVKIDGELFTFITGGWSGNEDIIAALNENDCARHMLWQSSHRGGKFVYGVTP